MVITATELKTNLGKYLDSVEREDVLVTKNGKIVARITRPEDNKFELLDSLVGCLEGAVDFDEARTDRLKRQ